MGIFEIIEFGNAGGIGCVAAITVIAYLFGMATKATNLDNKWIPPMVGIVGGFLGVVGLLTIDGFPANDILSAIAVGVVSGLASTGVHQLKKQLTTQTGGKE